MDLERSSGANTVLAEFDLRDKAEEYLPTGKEYRLKVRLPFITNRGETIENGKVVLNFEPRETPNEDSLLYGFADVYLPVPEKYPQSKAQQNGFELTKIDPSHEPDTTFHTIGVDTPGESTIGTGNAIARTAMFSYIKSLVDTNPNQAMMRLVHGAGCAPELAAKISAKMYLTTGRPVLDVDWATQDQSFRMLPPHLPKVSGYMKDERNYSIGNRAFQAFDRELNKVIAADQIIDVAQSLGNRFEFRKELYNPTGKLPAIRTQEAIFWSCSDIDAKEFAQNAHALNERLDPSEKPLLNVVLYNSGNPLHNGDKLLAASQLAHGGYPRLGQVGLDRDIANFVCIDMALISPKTDPVFGHKENYFLDAALIEHLIKKKCSTVKTLCENGACRQVDTDEMDIGEFILRRKKNKPGNHWTVEYKESHM